MRFPGGVYSRRWYAIAKEKKVYARVDAAKINEANKNIGFTIGFM